MLDVHGKHRNGNAIPALGRVSAVESTLPPVFLGDCSVRPDLEPLNNQIRQRLTCILRRAGRLDVIVLGAKCLRMCRNKRLPGTAFDESRA